MNKETTEINNAELSNYVTLLIAIPLRTCEPVNTGSQKHVKNAERIPDPVETGRLDSVEWNGAMERYFGNLNW